MAKQLFNNSHHHRGRTIVSIPMHVLYDLMHARIARIDGAFDADAVCQNICVSIEEQQGTYPNIADVPLQKIGRALRTIGDLPPEAFAPQRHILRELPPSRISSREHDMRSKSERALQDNVRANYEAFSAMRNDINEIIGNMPSQESALLEGPEMAHECAQIVEAVRAYADKAAKAEAFIRYVFGNFDYAEVLDHQYTPPWPLEKYAIGMGILPRR